MVQIALDQPAIAEFCRRWKVVEFALFGSVLHSDFRPDSDVDVLVTFALDAPWSTFDLVEMEKQLEELFGHKVDLVEKKSIQNPFRRHGILTSRQVIYAA